MVLLRARRLAFLSLAVILALPAAVALAAEPARVVFTGAEGCPSDSDLVVAVAARGRAIVSVPAGGDDVLRVTLRKEPSGYRGLLRSGGGQAATERELAGATCREVVDALAIVVAGALGPPTKASATSGAVASPREPEPAASFRASPASIPSASPPIAAPSSAPVEPPEREVRTAPQVLEIPTNEPATLRQYRDLTIFGGAMTGPLPGTIVPRVDVEARRSALLDVTRRYSFVVGPVLRVRVGYFGGGTLKNGAGTASVYGTSVGVAPCIDLRYRRVGLTALLCPEFAAGLARTKITARGSESTFPSSRASATFGVDGELVYAFGPRMHLAAKAGLDGQLARLTGERPDGGLVFRSFPVSFHALLGVGTSF